MTHSKSKVLVSLLKLFYPVSLNIIISHHSSDNLICTDLEKYDIKMEIMFIKMKISNEAIETY